jgi:hypothetical protein
LPCDLAVPVLLWQVLSDSRHVIWGGYIDITVLSFGGFLRIDATPDSSADAGYDLTQFATDSHHGVSVRKAAASARALDSLL